MADIKKDPVETDYTNAILKIADANNVIKEKATNIENLSKKEADLLSDIKRYESSRDEIKQDAEKERAGLEELLAKKVELEQHEDTHYQNRMAEVDAREADLVIREQAIKDAEIANEKNRNEAQNLIDANIKAQADVDSKLMEAKHLSSGRKDELNALEEAHKEAEMSIAKLEAHRVEVAQAAAEYTEMYNKVKASEENAKILHESIQKSREVAEQKIQEAIRENNSAEYNKGMATMLTASFRQALHTFCQISGTSIKIPELTNEHKEWIAKDLIKQTKE